MAKVMALDVGEKTVGVAFSDESETFCFPQKTIVRSEGYRKDMAGLRNLIAENGVEEIVIGLPIMMDGSRGIQAEKAEEFAGQLRRYTNLPIHMQDERLSTSEADKLLIEADRRRSERKQAVDSVAASLILQTFLDKRRAGGGR